MNESQILTNVERPPREEWSDVELLMEYKETGDEQVFAILVHRHEAAAVSLAFKAVGNRDDAEDLAQTSWMKVFNKAHMFDPNKNKKFLPWFYTIIQRTCIDFLRKKNKGDTKIDCQLPRSSADDGEITYDPVSPGNTPDNQYAAKDIVRLIIKNLHPNYGNILEAVDLYGSSPLEESEITGIPAPTLRWRLGVARELFKERYYELMAIYNPQLILHLSDPIRVAQHEHPDHVNAVPVPAPSRRDMSA